MAALSHSESRRLYSWWWDSHNSPKNSKWLQDNLTDMDVKVKSMIKLIEEDADSFARRAEMYYKKRPELMKLVEEFYRAYRALAERYNHATGELRHAHRTIAKAFPDQVPLEFIEDSPSKPSTWSRDPQTPESKFPVRVLFGTDDFLDDDKEDVGVAHSSKSIERAAKAESEVQDLKKALFDMKAEKENVLLKYQECLAKLCNVEGELISAQKDLTKVNEKASRAEIEVQKLKEALVQLEAEKNAGTVKHKECLEKISGLESMVSRLQEAESEAQTLKNEISRLEIDKEGVIQQYKHCLERVSSLENLVSDTENELSLLKKEAERAENKVYILRKSLEDLKKEKERSAMQYKCCMEMISKLERDIQSGKEEVECLNNNVLIGNLKLKTAEETCVALERANRSLQSEAENMMRKIGAKDIELSQKQEELERANRSLQSEAENLMRKIGVKDIELSEKQEELEKLQTCLHGEYLRHAEVEATLQSVQSLHAQSQDDQRALALELKNVVQTLKELEVSKNCLEEEIREVREENRSLSGAHSSLMENMEHEIRTLREIKERLEREVTRHVDLTNSLQNEILHLKEEIEGLNTSYQVLVETSLKSLQDENSKLREINEEGRSERENLSKKVENMQELMNKKLVLETSLSELNRELESSQEKVTYLQESCQYFHGEKATLIAEKSSLLSQIQNVTENMHNLLEKNAVLENTLSNTKVELEGLKEKSKGLENICELLKDERSFLLNERNILAKKLENVERKLESLEMRYTGLVEKYAGLEKEKEAVNCRVEELKVSLSVEKQERTKTQLESDTKLASFENQIRFLKEENSWKKKEFEEELERSLKAQFEISILHKFIKDMEEKNYALIIECQKHVEASKLAEKLISELENESLEQQVESEVLLDEIERLRLGIYRVFKAVETGADSDCNKIENDRTFLDRIVGVIEGMKSSISSHEDEKQLFVVENSVLLTLLDQLESKGVEIESQKMCLENEFAKLKNEKDQLMKENRELKSDVNESHQNVLSSKESLLQMEMKLEAAENSNMELMQTKEDLESNVLELSEISSIQKKEIESLHLIRRNFESEVSQLQRELEEQLIREKILSSELRVFELWEGEATAFYFDLQISSIHEVIFKNKVQELCGVCRTLEQENSTKSSEIERMNGKICSVESEIKGLKSQLCEYTPIVAAIRDDLMFVEQNALLQTKLKASRNHESEFVEITADPGKSASEILEEDQSLASLKNLHTRVKAVAKLMEEVNKPAFHRRSNTKSCEIEQPKSRRCLGRQHSSRKKGSEISETPKLQKIKTKPSEARSGMLMKDIPLDRVSNTSRKGGRKKSDQMLELWEDGNKDFTIGESLRMSYKMTDKDIVYDSFDNVKRISEPPSNSDEEKELGVDKWEASTKSSELDREVSGRRVLERLVSDAQKLENLQETVENLRGKLEVNRKGRKGKNMDYETVQEQLLEAEETVANLIDLNGKLIRSLEECPSPDGKASPPLKEAVKIRRRKVKEQARKGSERIGRLQLEMQKIQYMVLKMEDEKKNKMKNKFFKSKTIVLRDFIYNGRKNSGKRKKGPLCGCFRPSTSRNGNSP